MPYAVSLLKRYVHPRTKKVLSAAKALAYNKRAKKRLTPLVYLRVHHTLGDLKGLTHEQKDRRRKFAGKVAYSTRLTHVEKILPLKAFSDRSLRLTLGRHRVFSTLFEDFKKPGRIQRVGSIRITIGGIADGKKLRQITHLAFSRTHWLESFGSEERAYAEFKDWIVGSILSNLRRRDLRLSNPKESQRRIRDLTNKRKAELNRLDYEEEESKDRAGLEEQIKWDGRAIRKQKKSKQLTGAFIKIEKLI